MKRQLFIILLFVAQGTAAQITYDNVQVDYDSVWEYKSLRLIPVRTRGHGSGSGGNIISLAKAIQQGVATVSERGTASIENVHWLRINNRSDKTIFISSGETLTGGRQDRMVTRDTLLVPTGGDQYFSVMCIEEDRWSKKEKKFLYSNYANAQLRKVLDRSKNQVLVWKEIFMQLDSADYDSPTLAYAGLKQTKNYQVDELGYMSYFLEKFRRPDSSIVGFVCVSGDKVVGTDIFGYRDLFYDELEPLLLGYVNDAILHGAAPTLEEPEVRAFMDRILTDEKMQEEYCRKNGKIFRSQGKVIHLTAY